MGRRVFAVGKCCFAVGRRVFAVGMGACAAGVLWCDRRTLVAGDIGAERVCGRWSTLSRDACCSPSSLPGRGSGKQEKRESAEVGTAVTDHIRRSRAAAATATSRWGLRCDHRLSRALHHLSRVAHAVAGGQLEAFREGRQAPPYPVISDDEIRESIEQNQLKLLRERGADMTIFSPRASAMGHHLGDERVSVEWSRACNDLIARVAGLFPRRSSACASCPVAGRRPEGIHRELERCVLELGFVGCNLSPDPSGGKWTARSRSRISTGTPSREDDRARRARWCTSRAAPTRFSTRRARTTSTPTRPRSCS